jgi:hypothetical protein
VPPWPRGGSRAGSRTTAAGRPAEGRCQAIIRPPASCRIRAAVRSLTASPAAQRQNARCLTARAVTPARALRDAQRASRWARDDRVGDAYREREIRIAPSPTRPTRRIVADRPQRPPRDRSDLDDPTALQRSLELLPLRVPCPGGRVGQRGERIGDARVLVRPRDPLPGLRSRLVRYLSATLPERRDVALTPRLALISPAAGASRSSRAVRRTRRRSASQRVFVPARPFARRPLARPSFASPLRRWRAVAICSVCARGATDEPTGATYTTWHSTDPDPNTWPSPPSLHDA